jgi:hypothetical protein
VAEASGNDKATTTATDFHDVSFMVNVSPWFVILSASLATR